MPGSLVKIFFPPIYVTTVIVVFELEMISPIVFVLLLAGLPAAITTVGGSVFVYYTST